MKRLILASGLSTLALTLVLSPAYACDPVSTMNSGTKTAETIAESGMSYTGNVNATGCDVGIYIGADVQDVSIEDADIYGANFSAIYAENATNVTVNQVTISDIGNHVNEQFSPNGGQYGRAIFWYNSTGTITNSEITNYQKTGIDMRAGSQVTITGNTITGLGPVDFIAQNGIVMFGTGPSLIRDNLISDLWYTACSESDAEATGCIVWTATGIMLYNVDPSLVKKSKNKIRKTQVNYYVLPIE